MDYTAITSPNTRNGWEALELTIWEDMRARGTPGSQTQLMTCRYSPAS